MKKNAGKRITVWLGALQIFIGIGAIPAGIVLICDSSGGGLWMSTEMLKNSPFSNFLIPGIFLFLVNGLGSLLGGVASLLRYKFFAKIAVGLGVFLVAWILIQIWWVGVHWLHLMYGCLGIIELVLGVVAKGLNGDKNYILRK